ncbi:hypothetical protein WR25_26776 isoform A [Diploscapter pachys]|uniref:Methyltransferase HEMK2 n=1 Tax=Diploscapter pachys TaxID=2018661 RepID=A0A2A2KSE9_9BILA|nr:hypothetical protein WR25_26776 isoform A [Diploscapter pachys]
MSLPTPQYKLSALRNGEVYEPAEDTFLLIDAIEKDIKVGVFPTNLEIGRIFQDIRSRQPQIVLEIGCGSGVVSTFVNQALHRKVVSIATDVNAKALECSLETARMNGVNLEVIRSDLDQGLQRLQGKVDLLLFNPPYVPTSEEAKSNIERCWAGGPSGRSTLDRLLPRVPDLLSPKGVFYLVALHANDIPSLLRFSDHLKGNVSMERRCGIEHLYILRFVRI